MKTTIKKIERIIIYVTEHEFDNYGRLWTVWILIRFGWQFAWWLSIKVSLLAGYIAGLSGVHQ
jgi:hypothetical protein